MQTLTDLRSTAHAMERLEIPTGMPFGDFRAAFERAVPTLDPGELNRMIANGAGWGEVSALVERTPHGFVLFTTFDVTPLMRAAGHRQPVVEYLMGNHVLAEHMFRHHPAVLLYAPLRVLLYGDDGGQAIFVIDRPGTVFAGFDIPQVAAVGADLDRKVGALLAAIGVAPPGALG
ncbi:DUF302 domain-containing protein [Actinomadura craniellae]|uniref:DUF302 domain-containing protein n=1 Tax=Actinomadura craniellae TaxID=2231787 RepID=A0A365H561_9ACTN|nr:DUF302 domain-containing protein [Actinomadura craniellae]RAY14136.1 DUF302 domain-containing protein [Actinomadura craniellae]